MKKRCKYSYSILRYVHDVATSEFVNIGAAVHCADERFFQASFRQTSGRVSDFFPTLNSTDFRAILKTMSARFADLSDAYATPLDLGEKPANLESLLASVLPKDDSALIWSPISSGLTADPRKTLTDLVSRYVTQYDHKQGAHKRTDDEVRRHFSKALENRQLSEYFVEKTIHGKDDEIKFKSAWKNGMWHCVEPISFDLSNPESIREKAHKYLGQITSISDTSESFKVYWFLAAPTESALKPAFDKAKQILGKSQANSEIFQESETEQLVERLQNQISAHIAESQH